MPVVSLSSFGSVAMFSATERLSALAPSAEMIVMLSTLASGAAISRAISGMEAMMRACSASRDSLFCASASAAAASASAWPRAWIASALAFPSAVMDAASFTAAVFAASAFCVRW